MFSNLFFDFGGDFDIEDDFRKRRREAQQRQEDATDPDAKRRRVERPKYFLYELLEVETAATTDDVRRAYRKLARMHHPDKGGDPEKFKELTAAYHVLSDEGRRAAYDQFGDAAITGEDNEDSTQDLFDSIFKFGESWFQNASPKVEPSGPRASLIKMDVTLEELYSGATVSQPIERKRVCPCAAATLQASDRRECYVCKGSGFKIIQTMPSGGLVQQLQVQCHTCRGAGTVVKNRDMCRMCHGELLLSECKVLQLELRRGARHGDRIVCTGEGDEQVGFKSADLIIELHEKRHPRFIRKGDDLLMEQEIALQEALCGCKFTIVHLDGRSIIVKSAHGEIISPGMVKCLSGQGMPRTGNLNTFGNLIVRFKVKFPLSFNSNNARTLEEMLPQNRVKPEGHPDSPDATTLDNFDIANFGHNLDEHPPLSSAGTNLSFDDRSSSNSPEQKPVPEKEDSAQQPVRGLQSTATAPTMQSTNAPASFSPPNSADGSAMAGPTTHAHPSPSHQQQQAQQQAQQQQQQQQPEPSHQHARHEQQQQYPSQTPSYQPSSSPPHAHSPGPYMQPPPVHAHPGSYAAGGAAGPYQSPSPQPRHSQQPHHVQRHPPTPLQDPVRTMRPNQQAYPSPNSVPNQNMHQNMNQQVNQNMYSNGGRGDGYQSTPQPQRTQSSGPNQHPPQYSNQPPVYRQDQAPPPYNAVSSGYHPSQQQPRQYQQQPQYQQPHYQQQQQYQQPQQYQQQQPQYQQQPQQPQYQQPQQYQQQQYQQQQPQPQYQQHQQQYAQAPYNGPDNGGGEEGDDAEPPGCRQM